jgi:hypothetical protein
MTAPITSQLLAKCALAGMDELGTSVCAALGLAVDAGMLTLDQVLDLVRSCNTADDLGDALVMLAATVPAGEGATWQR